MLSSKSKDLKSRQLFLQVEKQKLLHKFLLVNLMNTPLYTKSKNVFFYKYFKKLNGIKYKMSTRVLNKCILSNRNRKTLSNFRLSRLASKDLLSFGLIPGYKKAVW
jgi:ribosomal protein S14